MKRVKIGDEVIYAPWSGPNRSAKVIGIEVCKQGEKYGTKVNSCNLGSHANGVLDLDDHHWCYFEQVKKVITH